MGAPAAGFEVVLAAVFGFAPEEAAGASSSSSSTMNLPVVEVLRIERTDLIGADRQRLPLVVVDLLRDVSALDDVVRVEDDRVGQIAQGPPFSPMKPSSASETWKKIAVGDAATLDRSDQHAHILTRGPDPPPGIQPRHWF